MSAKPAGLVATTMTAASAVPSVKTLGLGAPLVPAAPSTPLAAGGEYRGHGRSSGGGDSLLDGAFRSLRLFVKKKAGALSYGDDPTGVRSLLSRWEGGVGGRVGGRGRPDGGSLPALQVGMG